MNKDQAALKNEEDLKTKYGKVYRISVELEEDMEDEELIFHFRKPTMPSLNRAIKTMSKKMLESMQGLTLDSIVDEEKDEYLAKVDEYPGIVTSIGQKLLAMLGVTDNVGLKKL